MKKVFNISLAFVINLPSLVSGSPKDKYLGLLFSTESYYIYGYITVTNIKFAIILKHLSNIKEREIKEVCMDVLLSNPSSYD